MTDIFTASNGIEIEISQDGYLLGKGDYGSGSTYATAGPEGIGALREYFTHERDAELGRWRDPENPDLVIYPNGDDAVCVFSESTGSCWDVLRSVATRERPAYSTWVESAARYFAAHPEPKPWETASAGELWKVYLRPNDRIGRRAIAHGDGTFTDQYTVAWNLDDLTHATRIWPTEESDDE